MSYRVDREKKLSWKKYCVATADSTKASQTKMINM